LHSLAKGFSVMQRDDLSLGDRQPANGLAQLDRLRPPGETRRRGVCDLLQGGIGSLVPERSEELPVGDPVEPEAQGCPTLEALHPAPGPHEGLLGQILRRVPAPGEKEQVVVDVGVVVADKASAGLGISAADLLDECHLGG
jgi:hypothetical protein